MQTGAYRFPFNKLEAAEVCERAIKPDKIIIFSDGRTAGNIHPVNCPMGSSPISLQRKSRPVGSPETTELEDTMVQPVCGLAANMPLAYWI